MLSHIHIINYFKELYHSSPITFWGYILIPLMLASIPLWRWLLLRYRSSIHLEFHKVDYIPKKLEPGKAFGFVPLNIEVEEFLIIDLAIQNTSPIENQIQHCDTKVVYPTNWNALVIPLLPNFYTKGQSLGAFHILHQDDLYFPREDLFPLPLLLEPKKLYSKKLSILISKLPVLVDYAKLEITMTDNFKRKYKKSIEFHRENDKVQLIKKSKFVKLKEHLFKNSMKL